MLLVVGISAILFGVNGICVSVMARRLPKRLKEGEAPATEPAKPAAPEAEEPSEAEK